MVCLIYGGSGSGKSAYAEEKICELSKENRVYLATMKVYGEEGERKVNRHRLLRSGKGFETVECPLDIHKAYVTGEDTVLVECMSNLVANEMFQEQIVDKSVVVEKVLSDMEILFQKAKHVVIVTNNVFEDGILYDEGTAKYMEALGEINCGLAKRVDSVYEVVVGIPVQVKGEKK